MWEKYEAPQEPEPDQERPAPDAAAQPRPPYRRYVSPGSLPPPRSRPVRARPGSTSSPARGALGVVGAVFAVVVAVSTLSGTGSDNDTQDDRSDWEACIASYADKEPGLLTPTDWCEISHDPPPGYVDPYEDYDPIGGDDPDTWDDWEDEDEGSYP